MASFWHATLIRSTLALVVAAAACGTWLAMTWVSPDQVRASVEKHFHEKFGDRVVVEIGSAQLRIFGGLTITDLKLTRTGEKEPFLEAPNIVMYHDKHKLSKGELDLNKIELEGPTLRLKRGADGTFNVANLAPAPAGEASLPTVIVRHGTVYLTDDRPDGLPTLAVRDLNFTALNDPQPIVKLEASGECVVANAIQPDGSVPPGVFRLQLKVSGRFHRPANHIQGTIETGDIELQSDLAPALAKIHPKAAEYAEAFGGMIRIKASLAATLGSSAMPKYDVKIDLQRGRFELPQLPWPLEQLAGTIRLNDGRLTVEKMTGLLGKAKAELTLDSKQDLLCPLSGQNCTLVPGVVTPGPRSNPIRLAHHFLANEAMRCQMPVVAQDDPIRAVEDRLERFELKVSSLSLDDELFKRLNPDILKLRTMFDPSGKVDVAIKFKRTDSIHWRREVDVSPKGMKIAYQHFKYPVTDMYGSLKKVNASDGLDEFQADLNAKLAGKRITLTGRVAAESHDPLIDLTIAGKDIPIDDDFVAALPKDVADSLRKLHVNARGNFHVNIKQDSGVNRYDNSFKVDIYSGSLCYDPFPYSLQQVRGSVLFKMNFSDQTRPLRAGQQTMPAPDGSSIEIRNVEAVHDGGRFWLSGESRPVPNSKDRKLVMNVQGENCSLDDEFLTAFKQVKLDGTIKSLGLRGELTFGADVELMDRSESNKEAAKLAAENPVVQAEARLPIEAPFSATKDLTVRFNFRGPSMAPSFFPYDFHQIAGYLVYDQGRITLEDVSARHGKSMFKLGAAELRMSPVQGVWAQLSNINISPLIIDSHVKRALPRNLRPLLDRWNVRGPAEVSLKELIVSVPSGKDPKPNPESAIVPAGALGERWRATSPQRFELLPGILPELPRLVERRQPPSHPTTTDHHGLWAYTIPWINPPYRKPGEDGETPLEMANASIYWQGLVKLNGTSLDVGVTLDDLQGGISCEGRIDGPNLNSIVGNVWLDSATLAKQPMTGFKVSYRIKPQTNRDGTKPTVPLPPVAEFRDLTGKLYGGTIGGEARIILGEQPRYRVWLTAAGVKLEDVAKQNKMGSGELKGEAQGNLLLENVPDQRTGQLTLTGRGQLDVPEGRLYNLPVLLDLVKVLKGQSPDGVAFEEAHMNFELKGDRINVTQLDLLGTAVSLGGSGTMDMKGEDVKFEFYTIWSQTLRRMLMTPIGEVTGAVSGGLFKIELTRVNGTLTPKAYVLPAITDPMRAVAERWRNRFGRNEPNPATTVRGSAR